MSRKKNNAILANPNEVINHVLRMINEGKVKTINNEIITIRANTFCIHGDHENAINIAKELYQTLRSKGYKIG